MNVKRNNHIVTRGYLAGWRSENQGREGLWYFDIPKRSIEFSPGLRAGFAINRDIYAPIYVGGRRDDRFENWLAESESALCDLSRIHSQKDLLKLRRKQIETALKSIISAGYRSAYSIRAVEQMVKARSPDLSDEEVRLDVLNAVYAGSQDRIPFFLRGTIILLQNVSPPLLTNDMPFWDMTPRREDFPMGMFALSPTSLLVFAPEAPAIRGRFQLVVKDAGSHQPLVNIARTAAKRMARDWVVCANEAEAREVAEYLTEEAIAEFASTDKPRVLSISDVRGLFTLKPD